MNFKPTYNLATNGPLWRGVNVSTLKPVLILRGVRATDVRGKKLSTVNYKTTVRTGRDLSLSTK